jgi:hypothetical protein
MKTKFLLLICLCLLGVSFLALAGNPQRIGHTTLLPRNANPDDGGLYNAFIDVPHGYAYFLGNYLWKLSITNGLPVAVCAPTNTGSSSFAALDSAGGYAYISRNPALYRYALGTGTNAVTGAGSLTVSGVNSIGAMALDDSDPNPTNHNLYVFCRIAGASTRVEKILLGTFTEGAYTNLNAGETNQGSCLTDATHGYIYLATTAAGDTNAEIVKIKMTPGTNAPARIGSVNLGFTGEGIGFGSLDATNGYAYYGTYGYTNYPSRIYKVKLGDGDSAPSLVGHIDLAQGRAQLSLSVIDPANGFVYFANDNTYPGGVHQFKLNGTNLPVEIGCVPFLPGPSNNPPDTVSTFNVTTNSDGVLPYGEVYFRSAVFDPVRGNAYFGQDSKPNQVVMVHLASPDPVNLTGSQLQNNGFQFGFTNIMGGTFSVYATTNLNLALTNWTALGAVTDSPFGLFQFTDPQATNSLQRFYRVQNP